MESRLTNDNVKVVVRVRPPLYRELEGEVFISTVQVLADKKKLQLFQYYNLDTLTSDQFTKYIDNPYNYTKHQFTFDYIYDQQSTQEQVYQSTARLSVCSALEGYNATIFAYGQTGTGKTYTMEGFKYNMQDNDRGIIPRAIEDIFRYIQSCRQEDTTFMVRASYIQIYNENISDLLRKQKKTLQIRQDAKRGVFVEGVSEWAVVRPQQIIELMKAGAKSRATAKTNMNELSSRSHAVFIITIEQMRQNQNEIGGKQIKVAKLNLVDLAGSQRVRVTQASGKRLDQCKNINRSLSCLGMVISALTQTKPQTHIPYRNSSLTRLLSDSLGGNCKTTMLTMISPSPQAFHESLSSLKFAHRAKSIKNKPSINEDFDQKALIRKYENELKKLRSQLDEKNKVLIDRAKLMQLEQQKKKIQEDKNNVMKALQQRSKQFFKQRQQKKKLEEKIKAFNSQLIHGGYQPLEKQFAQQKELIKEYEDRIKSLESDNSKNPKENLSFQLFQKQNLILMSLASKLNERDDVNMHLNEELCAYDRITKENQQNIQRKARRIQQLENLLRKSKIPIPAQQKKLSTKNNDEEKLDGVYLQGAMTYNITQNNMKKIEEQISTLKQVNGQQQQEINRLKQELVRRQSQKQEVVKEDKSGYLDIRESIEIITHGLLKKQNTDMRKIISQIFNIKKIVNMHIEN